MRGGDKPVGGMGPHRGPDLIDDISPERRDEILDFVARKIADYGLITPAIVALEAHKPFSYIMAQGVHFFAPFGAMFMGSPYASEIAYLLEDRENIERLLERLEAISEEPGKKK